MGEVLSQQEIDNLLAALSTGELDANEIQETEEKPVKDYDFKRISVRLKLFLNTTGGCSPQTCRSTSGKMCRFP